MAYLDFQTIKDEHLIETVAERLGLNLTKRGNQLRGPCPISEAGGERALCITPAKKAFYSFGAGHGGDVIALVAFIKQIDTKAAAQWIVGNSSEESTVPKEKGSPSEGFKPLDYLEADHDAVVALGFEPEDADRIGVGYAKRGVMRGTVAVPVRLSNGQLIGYIGVSEAILPGSWRF